MLYIKMTTDPAFVTKLFKSRQSIPETAALQPGQGKLVPPSNPCPMRQSPPPAIELVPYHFPQSQDSHLGMEMLPDWSAKGTAFVRPETEHASKVSSALFESSARCTALQCYARTLPAGD